MITAREIIKATFIGCPGLKDKSPDEIIDQINTSIQAKGKNPFEDIDILTPVTLSYIKSNLKSVYYVIICDICRGRCRKAYQKQIYIQNDPVYKLLCGTCARIKYKRKTKSELSSLDLALHPEKLEAAYQRMKWSNNLKEAIVILEAGYLREELENKASQKANSIINNSPTIIE